MNGHSPKALGLAPPHPGRLPLAAHQPSLGARPHGSARLRQNLVGQIAGQPAGCRVALPLPVASPLNQSAAGHPDPQRMLAVLQNRVHHPRQARAAIDLPPSLPVVDQQPARRRHQQRPIPVEVRNADHSLVLYRQFRAVKAAFVLRHHIDALIPHAHPKVAVAVFPDGRHRKGRKSACAAQNLSPPLAGVAQFQPAAIPQSGSIHQNAVGLGAGCAGRLGKRVHENSGLAWQRREFHKSGLGSQVGVPFPIGLNALGPTDSFERGGNLLEAVAEQAIQSKISPHQKRAVRSFAKCRDGVGRHPAHRPKSLKALSVEAVDSFFRAHPEESRAVLVDLPHGQVFQPLGVSEGAKAVFLSAQWPACHSQQQHEQTRVGLASHYIDKIGAMDRSHQPHSFIPGLRSVPFPHWSRFLSHSTGTMEEKAEFHPTNGRKRTKEAPENRRRPGRQDLRLPSHAEAGPLPAPLLDSSHHLHPGRQPQIAERHPGPLPGHGGHRSLSGARPEHPPLHQPLVPMAGQG